MSEAAKSTGTEGIVDRLLDKTPLESLAGLMLLGDEYDRRARFAPAALAVAPLAVAAFALEARSNLWAGVGLATFVQITMTALFAHVGRVLGTLDERRMRNRGELPLQRWLCPYNSERSADESNLWRAATKSLVDLDYDAAEPSCSTYRRMGRDAFVAIQQALRPSAASGDEPLWRIQQAEYGFARNLVGMLGLWLASLAVGLITTGVQASRGAVDWSLFIVEILFFVCWAMVWAGRTMFEMNGAERLSESLMMAAVARSGVGEESVHPPRNARWLRSPHRVSDAVPRTCAHCGERWSGAVAGRRPLGERFLMYWSKDA